MIVEIMCWILIKQFVYFSFLELLGNFKKTLKIQIIFGAFRAIGEKRERDEILVYQVNIPCFKHQAIFVKSILNIVKMGQARSETRWRD